eukprot:1515616-Pleurochrysis_carterae.AAC.1
MGICARDGQQVAVRGALAGGGGDGVLVVLGREGALAEKVVVAEGREQTPPVDWLVVLDPHLEEEKGDG